MKRLHVLLAQGAQVFNFLDDIFNLDRKRMHDFCEQVIIKGLNAELWFTNGFRTDILKATIPYTTPFPNTKLYDWAMQTYPNRMKGLSYDEIDIEHEMRVNLSAVEDECLLFLKKDAERIFAETRTR